MARHKKDVDMDRIGARIEEIRTAHGETQATLAEAVGISRSLVKECENGNRNISLHDLLEIAFHYKCSVDYLLGLVDYPTQNEDMKAMIHYTGLSETALQELHSITGMRFNADFINSMFEDDTMERICRLIDSAADARYIWESVKGTEDDPLYSTPENADPIIPNGMIPIPASDAQELYVEYSSDLFRRAVKDFVDYYYSFEELAALLEQGKRFRETERLTDEAEET